MSLNFFIAQFPQATTVLNLIPAGIANLFGRDDLANIHKEKGADAILAAQLARQRATERAIAAPRNTGRALPTCLYFCVFFPASDQSVGKDWRRAAISTVRRGLP